jgi:hypothetical protein
MNARATTLLAAASAALALLLAVLWLAPGPLDSWRVWSPPPAQAPQLDDAQAAVLRGLPGATAVYPAVLERPLMQPSRRPEAAASAAAAAAPPPTAIEQVKLLGLLDGRALTGVMLEEQGKPRFVRQGEKVGDWTLAAIEGRQAVFTRGDERKRIDLPFAHLGKGAAAPAQPAAAGNPAATPAPALAAAAGGGAAPARPANARPAAAALPAPAAPAAPSPSATATAPGAAAPGTAAPARANANAPVAAFGGSAPATPSRDTHGTR